MGVVRVLEHPLIQHKVSLMRDKNTGTKEFRELLQEVTMLMMYEVMRDLPMESREVETPLEKCECKMIAGKKLAIVPVLRAGLGMTEGVLELVPTAKVGHIGLYRNEETLEPVEYYCKLPPDIAQRDVYVLDPMLATGGSAKAAISLLKKRGAINIHLVNLIGVPEGVKAVCEAHPDVDIYLAEMDSHLNSKGYIVPGLGDAGDRIFGTK